MTSPTSTSRPPGKALVLATLALLCIIWGTTWSVIQIGLEGVPPFSGVAIRFAIAAAILLGVGVARGIPIGRGRHEIALWCVNGVFSFSVSYGVVYWAEQWVPSGLASVLFALYPIFVAILAHLVLPAERMHVQEIGGAVVAFVGVTVIFSADIAAVGGDAVLLGAVVLLISPLSAAIGSVAIKRWGGHLHAISLTAVPMGMTAGIMGAIALGVEREATFRWDAVSISALLYLAIAGSAVTFTLYYWLLTHLPAKRLALIAYVIPVVAVIIGVLRGERLTGQVLVGSAIVIGGVALAVRQFSGSAKRGAPL